MKKILFIALLLAPLFLYSQTTTKIDDTFFGLRFGNAYSEKEIKTKMDQGGNHIISSIKVPACSFLFSNVKFSETSWDLVTFSTKTRYEEIPGILYNVEFMQSNESKSQRDSTFDSLEKSLTTKHGEGLKNETGEMFLWFDGERSINLCKVDSEANGKQSYGIILTFCDENISLKPSDF